MSLPRIQAFARAILDDAAGYDMMPEAFYK